MAFLFFCLECILTVVKGMVGLSLLVFFIFIFCKLIKSKEELE